MRILDSKDERDQVLVKDAPRISQFLCEACRTHFDEVRAHLTARGVEHVVDDALDVRGLDYYTRTAWEFIPVADGRAQATISGGGRYNGLAEQIGASGRQAWASAAGWSGSSSRSRARAARRCCAVDWFCAVDAPAARPTVGALLDEARESGLAAEMDLAGRSLKGQLRHAQRLGARVVSVIGPDEWERRVARVGDDEVRLAGLVPAVIELLMIKAEDHRLPGHGLRRAAGRR